MSEQSTDSHFLKRQPDESDAFYARRAMDPLLVALTGKDTRIDIAEADRLAFATSLEGGNLHEAVEFGADYTYRAFGIVPYGVTRTITRRTLAVADEVLKNDESLKPSEKLHLEMRRLDLMTILVASRHLELMNDDQLTIKDKKAVEINTAAGMRDIIISGARLLGRYQQKHDELGDDKERRDIRGMMFELLYATFARFEAYEAERYESEFVLGSTEFDDMAAKHYPDRNHNYDTLIINDLGETTRLIQCKNFQSDQAYESPIEKITSRSFGKFMRNTKTYVTALAILVSNRPETSEGAMQSNLALLKELFATEKVHAAQGVGRTAAKQTLAV